MTGTTPELLAGLEPADAGGISALGSRVRVATGQTLFDLGQQADSLYVIERGRMLLTMPMNIRGGEQKIVIEERLPGQAVGWSALIPPHRFTLAATAALDTDLVAFERSALLRHFASRPEVGCIVMSNLAALVGQRLQVLQAMWLREMQRVVALTRA
jgi:toluene monooxygenase system ferredoxin subunit